VDARDARPDRGGPRREGDQHLRPLEVIGPGVSNEDADEQAGAYIWEDHFYPEVVDLQTGKPVRDGEWGVLVLTTLTKEAMPLLRYWTGDITRLIPEPSTTGRTHRRMDQVRGRADDMLILRGVNLYPSQLEALLVTVPELSPHYQIVLERGGTLDEASVRAELREDFYLACGGDLGRPGRPADERGGPARARRRRPDQGHDRRYRQGVARGPGRRAALGGGKAPAGRGPEDAALRLGEVGMRRSGLVGLAIAGLAVVPGALAFCGFFVAKADAKLYNRSNQVIIARDGRRTVFSMMNDYQGDVRDFARIVPIPVVPRRDQIDVGDPATVAKLDAFSAPRLVEYFDTDPCAPLLDERVMAAGTSAAPAASPQAQADALGVKVEASYSVGEYDVVILSAGQSNGLETYLRESGYKLPAGAGPMLESYIRSGMKFFVVRVNLERFEKSGAQFLRPILLAYESDRFMLPIRLGTLNSPGEQDLTLYLLSSRGRVETSNYRTVAVPSNVEVPLLVKEQFAPFYRHLFRRAYEREGKNVAFLEYAWNTSSCDPCSAPPPTTDDLRRAGVFWQDEGPSRPVFITRLHVRYTRDKFPEDLFFRETDNQETFQGRYILRHPFGENSRTGPSCDAARRYAADLQARHERQAQTLASLTGWDVNHIRARMNASGEAEPWWRKVLPGGGR
jgi:hypothetical protein